MPLLRSTLDAPVPSTAFYAPAFRVTIDGRDASPAVLADVLEVKVTMDMENMSSFDLTVNNWDPVRFRFRYTEKDPGLGRYLFEVGSLVTVEMGYADQLRKMIRGTITSLSPRFSESGPPTIGVCGQDGMLKLRDAKPKPGEVRQYLQMSDEEIVQQVAARHQLRADVDRGGEKHRIVVQKNQDDAQFIMERAKRIDYDCYVYADPDSGDDVLYFKKPTDGRDGRPVKVYRLRWGESLISFNPTLSVSRQVCKVTVRGWDPANKALISYTASRQDLPGAARGGKSGPAVAEEKLGAKQEVVVDSPVTSQQEARDLAIQLLRERAYEFITGTGQVIGLPDLRPGSNLDIVGLGERFDGTYYLKKVVHTLGGRGFHTDFEVRKVYDQGGEP
jgi:uncharacterized protein